MRICAFVYIFEKMQKSRSSQCPWKIIYWQSQVKETHQKPIGNNRYRKPKIYICTYMYIHVCYASSASTEKCHVYDMAYLLAVARIARSKASVRIMFLYWITKSQNRKTVRI